MPVQFQDSFPDIRLFHPPFRLNPRLTFTELIQAIFHVQNDKIPVNPGNSLFRSGHAFDRFPWFQGYFLEIVGNGNRKTITFVNQSGKGLLGRVFTVNEKDL